MAENFHFIPSVIDGFNPDQREVIRYCLKKNITRSVKIPDIASYTLYENGLTYTEDNYESLLQAIISLAQGFVGSNNINLLMHVSEVGNRFDPKVPNTIQGEATAYYLWTLLSPIARKLFRPEDDPLVTYQREGDQLDKSDFYVPILPMILINGAEAFEAGWSTCIPNFSPKDVVANLRRLLNNEPLLDMSPWYQGFHGSIEKVASKEYSMNGIIKQINESKVEITELPVQMWIRDMKQFLEEGKTGSDIVQPFIKEYEEYHDLRFDMNSVHFQVTLTEKGMREALAESLESKFRLVRIQTISNMVALDSSGRIKKYDSVEEILYEFLRVRLETYQRRKGYLIAELESRYNVLFNKARFIQMITGNELMIWQKKRSTLIVELREKGFQSISKSDSKKNREAKKVVKRAREDGKDPIESLEDFSSGFDYLLSMPTWSFTYEKYSGLLKRRDDIEREIESLKNLDIKELYLKELEEFECAWNKMDELNHKNSLGDFCPCKKCRQKEWKRFKSEQFRWPSRWQR
ncbi:DNA topoisomerase II [Schizosaccharomyces osmophilus]|uniref:DNA topoisomerase (ATP-hydrolyzing) n=1 Tax=Schizosaccharomyces osmophilus TaxID=2545709 RepID=A0AAE9WFG1_9SCHI|nr:DNA topoisomerase II [Schizosaccharomyces osmophilus]WBW74301.1 DNA topoisomerase II [Schizosaccharomyces osmophilus]